MKKILTVLLLCLTTSVYAEDFSGVCASHILVQTERDAIKIRSQIKTYEDFQYYAKMYSECPSGRRGGNLGCFGRGQMVKPFEQAAFENPIGEVSAPIKTQFGYHLIWVTKKLPSKN